MQTSSSASLCACILATVCAVVYAEDNRDRTSTTHCNGCLKSEEAKAFHNGSGRNRHGSKTKSAVFDCVSGITDLRYEWSLHKQQWCCRHRGFGCSTATLSTSTTSITLTRKQHLRSSNTKLEHDDARSSSAISTTSEPTTSKLKRFSSTTTVSNHSLLSSRVHTTMASQKNGTVVDENASSSLMSTTAVTTLPASSLSDHTTSTKLAHRSSCFEEEVAWEPLSMPSTIPVKEETVTSCQLRCSKTKDCTHFSYWEAGQTCYLQDEVAIRQTSRAGFVSGPFQCWDNVDHLAFIAAGEKTYLPRSFRCMELHTLYSPIMGTPRYMLSGSNGEAAVACKAWCAADPACKHWTIQFPQRLCRLAATGAHKLSLQNSVSGSPKLCNHTDAAETEDGKNASVNSSIIIRAEAGTARIPTGYVPVIMIASSFVIAVAVLSSVMLRRASTGSRFVRAHLEEPMTQQSTPAQEESVQLTHGSAMWTPDDEGAPGPCRWMRKPQFFGREVSDASTVNRVSI